MRSRFSFAILRIVALALFCSIGTSPAGGQPSERGLVDGYSFGVGLSVYQGDLDRNPDNLPTQFLASGSLHLMAGADRELAAGRLGLEVHYNRLVGESLLVSGHHHVASVDLTYGRRLGRSDVVVFAGLGPAMVLSRYESLSASAEGLGMANEGAGFDFTIPIGVVFQDRVRLSTRVALLDRVDGTDSLGGRDLLTNISVTYRFERGR